MNDYHWPDLYQRAVALANGDRPGIELEGRIVQAFTEDPERVQHAIERIGSSYQRGDVRSFWPVLDTDLATPTQTTFTTTARAKQPSPWKITNEHEDPELPPAPRQLPDFVSKFMAEHWPKPLDYDPQ